MKKLFQIILPCLAGSLLITAALQAQTTAEAVDVEAVNEVLENPDFISASDQVRTAMSDFANSRGIVFGEEDHKGRKFYSASETVAVDETNAQWVKWRTVAYSKAFLKIRNQFLEDEFGKVSGETLSRLFQDDSDNRYDFDNIDDMRAINKEGEIYDKLLGLTGAKLDQALQQLGIDPQQYDQAPPEQRKNLFKDSLIQTTVKQAAGSLTGLIPIKTFVGTDSKGNHTIGVVAMYYGKLKQLADDIVKKRVPMLSNPGSGKPVTALVASNRKVLADTFGVRVGFNENGEPILISYAQWANAYNGSNQRKIDRGYDFAYKKARTQAQQQIAEFLSARAKFDEISNTTAEQTEDVIRDRDGNVTTEELVGMIDTLEQNTRVTFKADLRGIKEHLAWSYKFDFGQQVVGVVMVWTQKNAETTDNIRNWKPNYQNPDKPTQPAYKSPSQSGVRSGAGMDVDF